MGSINKRNWGLGISIAVVGVLSFFGICAFMQNVSDDNSKASDKEELALSYEQVAPLIEEHLKKNGASNEDGTISIPNAGGGVDVVTVEMAIQKLLDEGQLNYLKGDKGDRGENGSSGTPGIQGATGAQGPAGQDGTAGVIAAGSGLELSGGTLTLATCAVDQVLMVDSGSNWACAAVTTSSVDANTTNTSATLTLSGTTLTSVIVDSDGKPITSNSLELGANFATDTEVANAIGALNISQYATTTNLNRLTSRVATLETNMQNYVTSNQLVDSLEAYATEQWVTDQDFLEEGDLEGYATEQWVTNQSFVYDTALISVLGDYYTKDQIDEMHLIRGATQGYTIQVVDALPATPNPNVIYYIKGQ